MHSISPDTNGFGLFMALGVNLDFYIVEHDEENADFHGRNRLDCSVSQCEVALPTTTSSQHCS